MNGGPDTTSRRDDGGFTRRLVAASLVTLTCLSLFASVIATWANRNLLNTPAFVSRTAPIIDDPAVQQALATELTDQIMQLVDPKARIESTLPRQGQFLTLPLTVAARGLIEDRVEAFVASDGFRGAWSTMLEHAHHAAVATLRGHEGTLLGTTNGTVTIDLIPVIDEILAQIARTKPTIFGHTVTIPRLTFDDLPNESRRQLANAFGVDLTDDFGTITVYQSNVLSGLQRGLRLFDRLYPFIDFVTIALGAGALVVSRRRRRTLLQLLIGFALALVIVRRIALRSVTEVLGRLAFHDAQSAAAVALHSFIDPLVDTIGLALAGLGVGVVVLYALGPSRPVRAVKRGLGGGSAGSATKLQLLCVVIFMAGLWHFDLTGWEMIAFGVPTGAASLACRRFGAPKSVTPTVPDR